MEHFTPIASSLGGVLIGLSLASVLALQGRLAGISGICGGILDARGGELSWRVMFLFGLMVAGALGAQWFPGYLDLSGTPSVAVLIVAGLLVGFGTRMSNGCTSGHGVCGVARLSPRSIVATLTFMATGAATVFAVRHWLGLRGGA